MDARAQQANCDFCGDSIDHPAEQLVRIGSVRAATFEQIGIDVSWENIGKGLPAQLHEDCQETIMTEFVTWMINKVST